MTNTQTTQKTLSEQVLDLPNTSQKIRFLLSQGFTRSQVVKTLGDLKVTTKTGSPVSYQFVNNVMNQKVK